MEFLAYLGLQARDNLAWLAVLVLLCALLSPFQTWKLLSNNRPGRGSGWKMWLADRYIQIWLSKESLDSSDTPYELRMPMGQGGTTMDRPITRKQIDQTLESYLLVRRSGDLVSARKDVYLLICNWFTFIFCKWFLILIYGDSKNYYQELSSKSSKINRVLTESLEEGFKKVASMVFLLIFAFAFLKVAALAMPFLVKLLAFLFSGLQLQAPVK